MSDPLMEVNEMLTMHSPQCSKRAEINSISIIIILLHLLIPAATMAEFHFEQITLAVNEVPCAEVPCTSYLNTREVHVPIVISLTPPNAFLRFNIIVTISVTGNATCK